MTKLGIVTPVYNVAPYLRQCIESIIAQIFTDWQLVLVDDGSTDESGAICDEYAKIDSRITVIHQKNKGTSVAIAVGTETLNSEYLTFVDADDWIDKDTYSVVSLYMNQGIDAISFKIRRWFDSSYSYVSQSYYTSGLKQKDDIQKMFSNMIWDKEKETFGLDPSLCNKVVKYKLIADEVRRAGAEISVNYGQDVAVVYPLMMRINTLMLLDNPFYFHRQRHNGAIPSYLSDYSFYTKLGQLCTYLGNRFEWSEVFVKQIDLFFANSAKLRLKMYDRSSVKSRYRYMFPYKKIPVNSNVIIYGASEMGNEYVEQINRTNYANLVMQVDRKYQLLQEFGVKSPESIQYIDNYDYVIIAATQKDSIAAIKNSLLSYGVPNKKIIYEE